MMITFNDGTVRGFFKGGFSFASGKFDFVPAYFVSFTGVSLLLPLDAGSLTLDNFQLFLIF